ncbi:MAG: ribonuclease HII [Coriobacteriales bacterium]|nr:ribonuclease HII [Coriobacteriales bacterium]
MGNPASENVHAISARLHAAPLDELEGLVARYAEDPRSGVRKAVGVARRRLESHAERVAHTRELYARQREYAGAGLVVGIDEVGRGAVAGPLTVAAVALPDEPLIIGLDDSKKLQPSLREELALEIRRNAIAIGMAHIPPDEIDRDGMSRSLRRAMLLALEDAGVDPDVVLIDGTPLHICPEEVAVVGGDGLIASIAAASIVAKVTRDARMRVADGEYPGYHLASSKGYASPEHIAAIRELGLTPFHRATFCEGFMSIQDSLF